MKSAILSALVFVAATFFMSSPANASPLIFNLELEQDGFMRDIVISDERDFRGEDSILDVLRNDKRFSKIVKELEEHRGLRDDIGKDGITFLAPTNEAFKQIENVMENLREDRRRRRNRDRDNGDESKEPSDPKKDMEEILRYHIVHDQVSIKDLFNGKLLSSNLRESELGDRHQKIKVVEMFGQYYLNGYARVHSDEKKAKNGIIFALDHVLCPPIESSEMMAKLPFEFSSALLAAAKTELTDKIDDMKGVTIYAPVNSAWKTLGLQNMIYLFSPRGRKDLKKIVQYHIAKKILYSCDLMKEKKVRVRTLYRDEELEVTACPREGEKHNSHENTHEPSQWIFTINKGEARIQNYCADYLAENGVIQAINAVLIPRDMELPFAMSDVSMNA
ncbi:hypothetical protein HK098_000993 [Nowakowskiella sp. JEL0407]|nr:hypothetical protein HK098_000993 [Nowakowskiella sp. JEL0407]